MESQAIVMLMLSSDYFDPVFFSDPSTIYEQQLEEPLIHDLSIQLSVRYPELTGFVSKTMKVFEEAGFAGAFNSAMEAVEQAVHKKVVLILEGFDRSALFGHLCGHFVESVKIIIATVESIIMSSQV